MSENQVGKMEEAARKRRERLLAMRKKKNENKSNAGDNRGQERLPLPEPQLKFRNYKTENESLKESEMEPIKPADIKEHIADQLEKETAMPTIEVDLFKLAPRKPDWDLKRDLQKRLDKLERRTSHAIAEIVREKLMASAKGGNNVELPEVKKAEYDSD